MWNSFYQIASVIWIQHAARAADPSWPKWGHRGRLNRQSSYWSDIQSRHGAVQRDTRDTAWRCDARRGSACCSCELYSAVCTCPSTAQARGSLINVLCPDHALNYHTALQNKRSNYHIQRIIKLWNKFSVDRLYLPTFKTVSILTNKYI